ncbi:chemotaxis protein CheW [Massilia sp. 9096]|uniref:chemotaxis protein CheW n=1 Tax=Massilia sp. 9096 TaxID=1500894 RepID=UPI000563E769|nr:chemotaxis protein CheW [Massilia sp. 9096]
MAVSNALCLAEFGIGALRLGVPVEAVVEAIPLPAAPDRLPRRRGALAGVVEHHGRLVPVVDLARWVDVGAVEHTGAGAGIRAGARVLVLHEAGRTVGLKVDAINGLIDLQPEDVTRLHHDDDPEEVFHSAARTPEGGQVLSLLDTARLARLAAAWSDDAAAGAAHAASNEAAGAHADAATRLYALLQVGAQQLAVPAEALTEVIPMPALARFGGGIDSAWCSWRGRHLAILPPGALLAQAIDETRDEAAPLLAVIERDGLALGLPVRAALRLDSFADAGLSAAGSVVASTYDRDGVPVQLLDDAALFARFPEAAISGDGAPERAHGAGHGARGDSAAHGAGNACAYIVYEADGLAAVAIDAVERILGPHEAAAALKDADGAACMNWEGRAIPLRELRAPAQAQQPAPHLLLVRGADGLHACAVARVHILIPPGGGQVYRIGKNIEFITANEGAAQASYRIADLAAPSAAG